jgi:spore coat polysaccharide biosynthesis protein SpsF
MVAIIVQARMGSTRLAGKVLKPIAGRPMLSYQIERLRRVTLAQQLLIATTTNPLDDALVAFCAAEGVRCTRGSESDVLSRYCEAAVALDADVVVRVTADCPLLDPQLVDLAIRTFAAGEGCDYLSNMIRPTWPYGMAVEVVSAAALAQANAEARDPAEREHVTPFIYWRPQRFRIQSLEHERDLSAHRWTVDTPEDFELVSRILATLYPRRPQFAMADVLALLDEHPQWVQLNAHVQQKSATATVERA